jgi:protein TonB
VIHGLLLLAFMWGGFRAAKVVEDAPTPINVVYLPDPGPGGGGGGNPAPPAPARPSIPRATPPPPVPLIEPTSIPTPQPDPIIHASVMSNLADLIPSSGATGLSLGPSGGGRGPGVGPGNGPGLGPGSGGSSGGGPMRYGNGCMPASPIRQPQPAYTTTAMSAKVQGDVKMEVVVRKDGTVGDVRVVQSLDRVYGLDAEAIRTAKLWTFRPASCQGTPVDMLVELVLEFRIH